MEEYLEDLQVNEEVVQDEEDNILVRLLAVLILLANAICNEIDRRPGRAANLKRDRSIPLTSIQNWDEEMFGRQLRLKREDFNHVLDSIRPILHKDEGMAIRSSGSCVDPALKLAITLRILAGASYLDMYWYAVPVNSVSSIVVETCRAIYLHYQTKISLPYTDEEALIEIAEQWVDIQRRRYGIQLTRGILLAGDGYIVKIIEPSNVDNPSLYRNRHDCYALIVQAFCDAFCRFRVFDVQWPGSTNDITAYSQTKLFHLMNNNMLPAWVCIALDGIYGSCGGNHLVPFGKVELEKAKTTDYGLYLKMITYNRVISAIRVTIERAFGQLVRRFGILWKPIEYALERVPLIVTTCAILHNICIDRWLQMNEESGVSSLLYGPSSTPHIDVNHATGVEPDEEIMNKLRQVYSNLSSSGKNTNKRYTTMESIWSTIRITSENDLFTLR